MKKRVGSFLSILSACLLIGCGGGGSGTGIYSSGIQLERTLSSLTDEETQSACNRLNRLIRNEWSVDGLCTLGGVIGGYLAESLAEGSVSESVNADPVLLCQELRTQCLANAERPRATPDDAPPSCVIGDAAKRANCTATVSQIEECLSDYVIIVGARLDGLTCQLGAQRDIVESLAAAFSIREGSISERCDAIIQICPGIFDGQIGATVE